MTLRKRVLRAGLKQVLMIWLK